jgi:hypothetical protein
MNDTNSNKSNTSNTSKDTANPLGGGEPLFQGMDELEREVAPQQLSPDDPKQRLVELDEDEAGTNDPTLHDAPAPAPVANIGTAPSAEAAPPNQTNEDRGGAPGDPAPDARYPMPD